MTALLFVSLSCDLGIRQLSGEIIPPELLALTAAYSQLVLRGLPLDEVIIEAADARYLCRSICGKLYVKCEKCKELFAKYGYDANNSGNYFAAGVRESDICGVSCKAERIDGATWLSADITLKEN